MWLGGFGPLVSRQWSKHHVEIAIAQQFRRRVRPAIGGGFLDKFVHYFKTDFLVRFLTSAKAQLDPDLQIVAQECDGMVQLNSEIVGIDVRRELEFLHLV